MTELREFVVVTTPTDTNSSKVSMNVTSLEDCETCCFKNFVSIGCLELILYFCVGANLVDEIRQVRYMKKMIITN